MNNLVIIAIILTIESVGLWYTSRSEQKTNLVIFIALQLVIIALFGPKLYQLYGFITNIGGAMYASAIVACAVLLRISNDIQVTLRRLYQSILFSLVLIYSLTWLLAITKGPPDNQVVSDAIDVVVRYQPPIMLASLLGTIIALVAMGAIMRKFPQWWGPAVGVFVQQVVDSIIFYPIAFSNLPIVTIVEIMAVGLLFKFLCSVALIPAYFLAIQGRRQTLDSTIDFTVR